MPLGMSKSDFSKMLISAIVGAVIGWFIAETMNRTVKHKLPGTPA